MSKRQNREEYLEQKEQERLEKKQELINIIADDIISSGRIPSRNSLASIGINQDCYRRNFGTLSNMLNEVFEARPDTKEYILTADMIFNPEMIEKVNTAVKEKKRYILTTAVTGMPVDVSLYETMKMYCAIWDAELLILLTTDPAANVPFETDPILKNELFIIQDTNLNNNLKISTFKTSAKQINTLTGLRRIGEREQSMVVASPKQFIEYIPVLNTNGSHVLLTTGSITLPNYLNTDRYMSMRTAWLADQDHEMGGVIIEIEDNEIFHFRPFQSTPEGSFIDLGVKYSQEGAEDNVRPEALVLGDIHVGSLNDNVEKTTDQIIEELNPKRVFWHDLFDGYSCNPHSSMQYLTRAKMHDKLSIENELKLVGEYITNMKNKHPNVEEFIVVRSNHDLFLDRYLESGEYTKDPVNYELCHKLAVAKFNHHNPLKYGLEMLGFDLSKVTFLEEDDSYRVSGYECGQHGHRGSNGVRNPSNAGLEVAYGKGVFGHSHTGGKLRKIFRVGTSTNKKLGYNKGASSWTHTFCLIYPDGSAQLVNDINGKFKKAI